jgi:hypothetical protein
MLNKQERKQHNEYFWAAFQKYMKPFKSSNGRRINWINYPSDIPHIFVRMEVDTEGARLCFDVQFKDSDVRSIVWEQLLELKVVLEEEMQHPTNWEQNKVLSDGRTINRISWELKPVNYLLLDDHALILNFLQKRLLEFDRFYQEFKDVLILLIK